MTTEYLTRLLSIAGLLVSLIGAALAVPNATRHMGRWTAHRLGAAAQLAKTLLGRRGVRARVSAMWVSGGGGLEVSGAAAGSARLSGIGSLSERVEQIEVKVNQLQDRLGDLDVLVASERAARESGLQALATHVEEELENLRSGLERTERHDAEVNARALLIVGWGAVLAGIPDVLALAPALAVLLLVVALVWLQTGLIQFWSTADKA